MPRKRKDEEKLQNPTADRLDMTPFSKISDLRNAQEQVNQKVWTKLEEASQTMTLMKKHFPNLLTPLRQGIKAKYSGTSANGLGHGYLDPDEFVQVDIDEDLKSDEKPELTESIIRGLSTSIYSSFYDAIGLTKTAVAPHGSSKKRQPDK